MGRPSKAEQWQTDDGLALLEHWKRNDLTDAEIAKRIGIKPKTLQDWKGRFPLISAALKKGSEYSVADAEKAITSKFGITEVTETKVEEWTDADGNERRKVTTTTKQLPPDTVAIIFFLKAKAGWRENADLAATESKDNEILTSINDVIKRRENDNDPME